METTTLAKAVEGMKVPVSSMRLIPAGSFQMGSEGWGEYESPIHEVFVDDFFMDETPVTNLQFAEFVKQTGYVTTAEINGFAHGYEKGAYKKIIGLRWKSYFAAGRERHPVILVSWHDANEYAMWAGKRLPSEAEWEKAARGSLIQKMYPWGGNEPNRSDCNFAKETIDIPATTEVGSFAPNEYGLFDMAGNVWNWCADWFSGTYYSESEKNNPRGPKSGETKIRRGASFNIIQTFRLRCSNRGAYDPNGYAINIGFRCVKGLKDE
ncbi:MAG: formylglycine-generating enzyme family protein [Ignavibacteriae bacterium]|nr:formylglycine-generating enzyme family protein [Ignavibacteria bacterium]MBI3364253.1 formylglycine-generating enzyme family protein [Ignavibacteriota bacterium]